MRHLTPIERGRKSIPENSGSVRRILRRHGPRFIRGRRSKRLTTVWLLRARRLADGCKL